MRGTFAGPKKLLSSISFTRTNLGTVFVFKFLDSNFKDHGVVVSLNDRFWALILI